MRCSSIQTAPHQLVVGNRLRSKCRLSWRETLLSQPMELGALQWSFFFARMMVAGVDVKTTNIKKDVTIQDACPLPLIGESLVALEGSLHISTFGPLSGYWQMPLDEDVQEKSAFAILFLQVLGSGRYSFSTSGHLSGPVGLHWKTLFLNYNNANVIWKD